MKPLKPQPMHDKYTEPLEAQLRWFIYTLVYEPLKDIMKDSMNNTITNSDKQSIVEKAITRGQIIYNADMHRGTFIGVFAGRFNAALGRELRKLGAQWDRQSKVFRLKLSMVPPGIRAIATVRKTKVQQTSERVLKQLDRIQESMPDIIETTPFKFDKTMKRVTDDFKKLYEGVEVQAQNSPEFLESMAKNYGANIKPTIKGWVDDEILRLRQDVSDNARAGYRADHLAIKIQKRYGTTKKKAKFIARQETSLFMASYRKEQLTGSGVKKFRWSATRDSRVRDEHKDLHGRVFYYTDPPIIDKAKGTRGLPGQAFGCRCVDIPIMEQAA